MRLIWVVAVLLLISLSAAISGCLGCSLSDLGSLTGGNGGTTNETDEGTALTVITSASEIDEALANGPVFVKFGAEWCGPCRLQEPILGKLATDYPAVTFLEVDTDDTPKLAREYHVNGIPNMVLIVEKNSDGKNVYVGPSGQTTTDLGKAAIVGLREYGELRLLIEKAVSERGQ